jgi:hypothetical protein
VPQERCRVSGAQSIKVPETPYANLLLQFFVVRTCLMSEEEEEEEEEEEASLSSSKQIMHSTKMDGEEEG